MGKRQRRNVQDNVIEKYEAECHREMKPKHSDCNYYESGTDKKRYPQFSIVTLSKVASLFYLHREHWNLADKQGRDCDRKHRNHNPDGRPI